LPPKRRVAARTPEQVLELAAALKRENPMRSATQIERILRSSTGWSPSPRTLQRHFERLELDRRPDGRPPQIFGRFEALRPNELWVGDALHGPKVAGRKTFLFCFIDDHSRAVVGARWGYFEDTVRLAAAFRPALAARGVPEAIYVDNGSAFVDAALKRAAAKLGIKITHSAPGRPQGRGKIERFFRTVREQFLVEIDDDQLTDLGALNRLFVAWVEGEYHRRPHSETGQPPLQRWLIGAPFPQPTPPPLAEAFKWSEYRQVSKTAVVKLFANRYCVDAVLVGRTVELVFDPFDLTAIEVRWGDKPMGLAVPQVIGRHAHPKAKPEQPDADPPPPTGIDYLQLLADQHNDNLARRINYGALTNPNSVGATTGNAPADDPTDRQGARETGQ
jgi:putative transposase